MLCVVSMDVVSMVVCCCFNGCCCVVVSMGAVSMVVVSMVVVSMVVDVLLFVDVSCCFQDYKNENNDINKTMT